MLGVTEQDYVCFTALKKNVSNNCSFGGLHVKYFNPSKSILCCSTYRLPTDDVAA